MGIKDDVQAIRNNAAGADALTKSEALRQQETDLIAIIATQQASVKANAAIDVFIAADLQNLGNNMELLNNIQTLAKPAMKAELILVRDAITPPPYKAEIQDEIDLYP